MKNAQVGGEKERPAKVENRSIKERVWVRLLAGDSQRQVMKNVGCSRYTVRSLSENWVKAGWLLKKEKGGVQVTDKAPKSLRKGWAATPMGSPHDGGVNHASSLGEPTRLHRRKLGGDIERSVDPSSLNYWENCKASRNGVVYHNFDVPCETSAGLVDVPIQIIQPKKVNKSYTLVIQSCNIMAWETLIVDMGYVETHVWVKECMEALVRSWLGDKAVLLGPLSFRGKNGEDMEAAIQALPKARVGGDVQKDFAAVDAGSKNTPFTKEEEQNLKSFLRLRNLEREILQLQENDQRIVSLLERSTASTADQLDKLAAISEGILRRIEQ